MTTEKLIIKSFTNTKSNDTLLVWCILIVWGLMEILMMTEGLLLSLLLWFKQIRLGLHVKDIDNFFWCTYDDLNDVKTIYTGIAMNGQKPVRWELQINLNTVQDHHVENNINQYITKIFNLASFDKTIKNYDEDGKPSFSDRATFILMTNLNKLPCVESTQLLTEEQIKAEGLDELDFSKIESPIVTKEEILNSEISGDCMLITLEYHGLTVDDLPESNQLSPKFEEWFKKSKEQDLANGYIVEDESTVSSKKNIVKNTLEKDNKKEEDK